MIEIDLTSKERQKSEASKKQECLNKKHKEYEKRLHPNHPDYAKNYILTLRLKNEVIINPILNYPPHTGHEIGYSMENIWSIRKG